MKHVFARFRLLSALSLLAVAIIVSGCAHYGDGYSYRGPRYSPHSSYSYYSYGHHGGHGRGYHFGHGRGHYGGHYGYHH